jgi:vitamin B12 transporter
LAKFSYLNIWFFICFNAFVTKALAQQQDTTSYNLKVVDVFGKPTEAYAVGSRVTYLDSTYLSTYTSASLAEALQARTPIYFKTYGTSGIASTAFRGTNASQTAVLWNGLNIASPTLGQSDFSSMPMSGFGAVSLQSGAAAANYGSGAIGGAVLLSSPDYSTPGLKTEMQLEAGSFGHSFGNGSISYKGGNLTFGINAYARLSENNFPYKDLYRSGAPVEKQTNAAFKQKGFTQDLIWPITPNSKLALHSWYTTTQREVQPAMGSAYNDARQRDENLRVLSEFSHDSQWGQTSIKAALFKDYLHYSSFSADSEADIYTYQLQAEQNYTPSEKWSLRGGINLQRFEAESDGYAKRQQENRVAAFALLRYDPSKSLKLSLNLRQAFVKGYDPLPTPALGLNWKFYNKNSHQISLKGSFSGSYRLPTLNDRFWAGVGNPFLKPEQGWSYEGGLRHIFTQSKSHLLETELTVYQMHIDDWIQWSPDNSGRWRPANLKKVTSKGMEGSTKATYKLGSINLGNSFGYTYTRTKQAKLYEGSGETGKQLMYVPFHKAVFTSDASYKGWTLTSSMNYTGLRYTNNSESDALDGFLLLNAAVSRKITVRKSTLIVGLRSENITDTDYQTMAFYAMPPRSYTFSLRILIP